MITRKAAAAIAVAILAAATYPALNRAQEVEIEADDQISEQLEGRLRQEEKIIRRAEQQAHEQAERAAIQAVKAEQILIKAANADRNYKVVVDSREIFPLGMRIRDASARVRDAKEGEARDKASKELHAALDEYFEIDMQARTSELESIRSRLAKLERQLGRRREKKAEIIDLQMKVALNEADGLGFYSEKQDRMFNFPFPPPPTAWSTPADVVIQAPVPVGPVHRLNAPAPPAPPAPALYDPRPQVSPEPEAD